MNENLNEKVTETVRQEWGSSSEVVGERVVARAPAGAGEMEAFVTSTAPELLRKIALERTALGTEIKKANARTGGSAVLEEVELKTCDALGLELACSVKRRAGGFGRKFETRTEETEVAWEAIVKTSRSLGGRGEAVDGATAQRRLMEAACNLELARSAAALLDARFPGGLGDAGRLPDNLWLNNVPASPLARSHLSEACIASVLEAINAGSEAPDALSVVVKPPELDVEMDTYRIGTLLELVRAMAFQIIDKAGKRVRICVQAPMGEGIFAGMPLSLNGVRKLLQMMDWGPQADELMASDFIRFGAIGPDDVDDKDDVIILIAPQSIVGSSIVPPLQAMVDAARALGGTKKLISINARLDDIQSSQGVMSYRGRADRLDFVDSWEEIFHFSLVVPIGRTFFPILGAVVRPFPFAPFVLYQRQELCSRPNMQFQDSRARVAAVKAGDLLETYRPIGCYAAFPDAKQQKPAFREAYLADQARLDAAGA